MTGQQGITSVLRTLTQQTYLNIKSQLMSGELPPGSQLVSRSLAERWGVSLAPVREAMGRLAAEGLIEHIPGAGAFVREISRQDLYELFVLREALEPCAAAEAAVHAHVDQIAQLLQLCQQFDTIAARVPARADAAPAQQLMDQWLDCEERFHSLVVAAARNSLLARVCQSYRSTLRVFEMQRARPKILTSAIALETCASHRGIVEAIRNRDQEAARTTMLTHVQRGRQTVMEFFQSHSDLAASEE